MIDVCKIPIPKLDQRRFLPYYAHIIWQVYWVQHVGMPINVNQKKDHTKNGHIKQCALYFEIESPRFIKKKIDDNNTLS